MRHQHVGKHELGLDAASGFDGVLPAVHCLGDEAAAIEDLHDRVGDQCFIVHHQNARKWVLPNSLAIGVEAGVGKILK